MMAESFAGDMNKNRPKTNTTNDYASQIAEKQESITSFCYPKFGIIMK